jgi:hypothetical protein
MDWFIRNEDDLYSSNNNLPSLSIFKEPSEFDLFRTNNPQEQQDYEIKPFDFFVEKETTKSNSKMDSPSPKYQSSEGIIIVSY